MKIKKMFILSFCLIIILSLVSCGSKKDNKNILEGDKFEVTFSVDEQKSTKSNLVITTNLPYGMKMKLKLKAGKDKFLLTKNTTVKGGDGSNFVETGTMQKEDGTNLKDGRYILMIESCIPSEQSSDVIKYIGKNGEKMAGNDVYYIEDQLIAKMNKVIELKNGHFINL